MAFKHEGAELWREIRGAERARDTRLAALDSILRGYHGTYYQEAGWSGNTGDGDNPENFAYQFVTRMVPELVFHNPKVKVTSRRSGMGVDMAHKLGFVINRWVADNRFGRTLLGPIYDAMFSFGVLQITREPAPGVYLKHSAQQANQPQASRLSPRCYFRDPWARTKEEARYEGHEWTIDKDDLLALARDSDDGWRVEEIEGLPEGGGDAYKSSHREAHDIERPTLTLYEFWDIFSQMDGYSQEDGFYGTILTLALADTGEGGVDGFLVRDPRPYYGPPQGPYCTFDCYTIPDQSFGLSPLVAMEGLVRDLNRHARGSSNSAARWKRLILVDDTDPDLADKIQSEETDVVIPISGLKKELVVPVEVGGLSEQNIAYLGLALDRLQRVSSHNEVRGGISPGTGTATGEAIAEQNADLRTNFLKQRAHDFANDALDRIGWFVVNDEEFRMPLGQEEAIRMGLPNGVQAYYNGGIKRGEPTYDDYELRVEAMSMSHKTPTSSQKEAITAFQVVLQIAQMSGRPIDWDRLVEKLGSGMDIPDLADMFGDEGSGPSMPIPQEAFGRAQEPSQASSGLPGYSTGAALGAAVRGR